MGWNDTSGANATELQLLKPYHKNHSRSTRVAKPLWLWWCRGGGSELYRLLLCTQRNQNRAKPTRKTESQTRTQKQIACVGNGCKPHSFQESESTKTRHRVCTKPDPQKPESCRGQRAPGSSSSSRWSTSGSITRCAVLSVLIWKGSFWNCRMGLIPAFLCSVLNDTRDSKAGYEFGAKS